MLIEISSFVVFFFSVPRVPSSLQSELGFRRGRRREEEGEREAMASAVAAGSGRGLWEGFYRLVMRRNSVYVTFVVAGAFLGERVMIIFPL